MSSEKLCTNLSQEKKAFYCLLKQTNISRAYVERACFNKSLSKVCIEANDLLSHANILEEINENCVSLYREASDLFITIGDYEKAISSRLKAYSYLHNTGQLDEANIEFKGVKRLYDERFTVQPAPTNTKLAEGISLDRMATAENKKLEVLISNGPSMVLDDLSEFKEELLTQVPIGKKQLKKMVKPLPTKITKVKNYSEKAKDYEEIAQKMRDTENYSAAAINICCASLAWILADESKHATHSLQSFIESLDAHMKAHVTSHPAFLLARSLISAVYHKDKGKLYEAEVYSRKIKFQYSEDGVFIVETMRIIEEMLQNQNK